MISVAMATYNGEKYIRQQLNSILNQSLPIDELVIVDDVSTDQTVSIIEEYTDKRIKFYKNQKNLGYINNFYTAIKYTQGNIIFLADQDDIWNYDKVKIMVDIFNRYNCTAVCSASAVINSQGHVLEKNHTLDFFRGKRFIRDIEPIKFEKLIFQNVSQGCTLCFNDTVKKCYLKVHDKKIIHDWQITLISSLLGNLCFINKPLIFYRIHEKNALAFTKNIHLHKPSKKPTLLCFLSKVDICIHITFRKKIYAYIVCYMRLPLFRNLFFKLIGERNV